MAIFSYEQLDELGDGLIRQYLGKESGTAFCVDIEGFVTDFLHLPILYRSFAERDTDKIGFISDGITPLLIYEKKQATPIVYEKGTIVIERFLRQEPESGRRRFTISHEGAHFVMDRTVPQASFHREFDIQRVYSPAEIKDLFRFKEAMIDRLGASLLIQRGATAKAHITEHDLGEATFVDTTEEVMAGSDVVWTIGPRLAALECTMTGPVSAARSSTPATATSCSPTARCSTDGSP